MRLLFGILLVCVGLVTNSQGGGWVYAAEWSAEPALSVRGIYNSNLLVNPQAVEVWGYSTSPSMNVMGSTERFQLSSRVAADFVHYDGDQRIGYTNIFLPLSATYSGDRDTFEFVGGFTRDNTLRSELLSTGIVASFTQRNLWSAAPSWTHSLTERLSIQSAYQLMDATYEDASNLGLANYQLQGVTETLHYQLTEQDQLSLTGLYTNFHTKDLPLRAQFPGVVLSAKHAFTETLVGSVFGGAKFISSTTTVAGSRIEESNTVWVYGASLKKELSAASIVLEYNRDVTPSGFGLLVTNDRLSLTLLQRPTETLSISLDARVYFSSGATTNANGVQFTDLFNVVVTPRIDWRWNEFWTFNMGYRYVEFDAPSFATPGRSHAAFIGLTYTLPKWSISR